MAASQYEVIINTPNQVPELIARASSLSIAEVKQAMHKGAVWISDSKGTRRLRRAGKKAEPGAVVHFYYNPDVLSQQAETPELFSDENEYGIWIKPRGVLSHGSKWGDHSSITRLVETADHKHRPAFLVHRLDRAATGLIIIGHARKPTKALATMFASRQISKSYQAIVIGHFTDSQDFVSFNNEIDGKKALTYARLLEYDAVGDRSLLEINIESGRKHQIRKHLSQAGYPVVGDRLYGGGADRDLQLAAVSLGFRCPVSGKDKYYELPQRHRPYL